MKSGLWFSLPGAERTSGILQIASVQAFQFCSGDEVCLGCVLVCLGVLVYFSFLTGSRMAETALDFVVEDGPELILLSALLKSWDYRYVQPARFTSLQFFKVDVIISGLEMNLSHPI